MLPTSPTSEVGTVAAPAARLQSVSGRYEGLMTLPHQGKFRLDLRVDIDASTPNSPVTNRVSGDFYQIFRVNVPGAQPTESQTYLESWIIDQPEIDRANDQVEIAGTLRFWTGTHAKTSAVITISHDSAQQVSLAKATFTETGGAQRSFMCHRASDSFRALELEVDVCASVNKPPILPTYDTHWHNDRPADVAQRVLTIQSAYREIGVDVRIDANHTIIDDSAPEFESWTPAELHHAMETHFSQFGDEARFALWGLLAGRFENPSVGGIMFDAAAGTGGAGEGPERQGFAVFRNHTWFEHLVDGPPGDQDQARSLRHLLYTWVHEAGHAFNFLHSWNKGRPDALSWMNYDWRYDQRNGDNVFWKRFIFRCDDDELIHVRHGNRAAVIMGGDPWSSGSHLEAPNLAMTQIEGDAPVEFLIRSKEYFEFMEPVIVEFRLRNLTHMDVTIEKHLQPHFGATVVYIQKPDGHIVEYKPPICALADPEPKTLASIEKSATGENRFSREVFLSYGVGGFYFDRPGEYKIRAVYQGLGDFLVPSMAHRIRIAAPQTKQADRIAQDFFSDDVGLGLYLQGSKSPYLKKGIEVLQEVADQNRDSMLGAQINMALAQSAARPFFSVTDTGKMKKTAKADPEEALRLTAPALKVLQRQKEQWSNLPHQRVVQRRAEYHKAAGTPEQAKKELSKAKEILATRGVHQAGLKRTEDVERSIAESAKPSRATRIAARKAPARRAKPKSKPRPKSPSSRRRKPKPA